MPPLLLFTRAGCCLCEGLAERLRALEPPVPFTTIDVDTDPALQARWGLEVPVLAHPDSDSGNGSQPSQESQEHQGSQGHPRVRPLPRVPPRLEGERLRQWLERHGAL